MYAIEDVGYLVRFEEIKKDCNNSTNLKLIFITTSFISSKENNLSSELLKHHLENDLEIALLNNNLIHIYDKNSYEFKDVNEKNYRASYFKCLRQYNGTTTGLESVYSDVSDEQFTNLINLCERIL